jgi:predicted N-acetyltransferase YhbS
MSELAAPRERARAERLEQAVAGVQARLAPLFPDGETQDTGHAIWTTSTTPLIVANGVIHYDARDFHGPESERELDSCLAVLSTYDMPWRFSAWDHLGADVLVPFLVARGMTAANSVPAMWLNLPGRVLTIAGDDGIEIRPATNPAEQRTWSEVFTEVFDIPEEYTDLFEQLVARPSSRSLVAHAGGVPVGCLSISIEQGLAVLHSVGVLPSARRQGVGRRLLQAAHEEAAARGAAACVIVADPDGSELCTRLGYQAVTGVTYLTPAASQN